MAGDSAHLQTFVNPSLQGLVGSFDGWQVQNMLIHFLPLSFEKVPGVSLQRNSDELGIEILSE